MKKGLYPKCKIWWCSNPHYSKGYCMTHYRANYRFGSPYGVKSEVFDRIDKTIELSRKVAQAIINSDGLLEECPYCHSQWRGHAPDCPIQDAKKILEMT